MYERLGPVLDDNYLDLAFLWLCKQRKRWPDHADVWSFRRRWHLERQRLADDLAARRFRFDLRQRVASREGDPVDLWSARDAVVLKALSLALGRALAISPRCFHVKGHGGAKAAVREVLRHLPHARFVVRTDVRDYYASIDHVRLLDRLAAAGLRHTLLNLVGQMCCRTSQRGGLFYDFRCGIPRGCPLSPLLGAFFLKELDERLEATGLFFVRYMDDIVVLAPTRRKLRRAVKIINETFASLGLEKHPDKTFIGRVEKGFDFLGYRLTPAGLSVAPQTFAGFIDRAHRLALDAADRSLRMMPTFTAAFHMRATVCELLNQSDAAHDSVRRLRALDPEWTVEQSLRSLALFLQAHPVMPAALAAIKKAWDETPLEPRTA